MNKQTHLVILRGNSGCGKTSIAHMLRETLPYNVLIISQDVIRRDILNLKEGTGVWTAQMLEQLVWFGNGKYTLIVLEGILPMKYYEAMIKRLLYDFENRCSLYYFDASFETTLKRHRTKKDIDFGEHLLKEWWIEDDYVGVAQEILINDQQTPEEIISLISEDLHNLS